MIKNKWIPTIGERYTTKDNITQFKVIDYLVNKDIVMYLTTANEVRTAPIERFRLLIAKYDQVI